MPRVQYARGDFQRSRTVGATVLSGKVALPVAPKKVTADWERDIRQQWHMQPGDVQELSLPRTCMRWPGIRQVREAVSACLSKWGLQGTLADADQALMACRGAPYHHDADQYGAFAFCNVFLSEDKGLDVYFPDTGQRISLQRGTVMVFDPAQLHAVVRRGAEGFDAKHFGADEDCSQVFLTWELPIDDAVARALGVVLDSA